MSEIKLIYENVSIIKESGKSLGLILIKEVCEIN